MLTLTRLGGGHSGCAGDISMQTELQTGEKRQGPRTSRNRLHLICNFIAVATVLSSAGSGRGEHGGGSEVVGGVQVFVSSDSFSGCGGLSVVTQ